jgi:uncharacterized protein (DUF2384 family)
MNDPFRRRARNGPILSPDEGRRQIRAVRAAQAALGSVEAVRAFLNSHHPALDGRPIDLAVASEAGLAAVEEAIGAEGQARAARPEPSADNDS